MVVSFKFSNIQNGDSNNNNNMKHRPQYIVKFCIDLWSQVYMLLSWIDENQYFYELGAMLVVQNKNHSWTSGIFSNRDYKQMQNDNCM